MRYANINGGILHYACFGNTGKNAPSLVFVNSLGTDLRSWEEVIAALPPDIRIICYDKRGHGLSPPLAKNCTVRQHAEDLHALLKYLNINEPVVCGVSIGGMIAPQLALLRRLRGLVLCCSGLCLGSKEQWDERIRAVEKGGMESIADSVTVRWFSPHFHQNHADSVYLWRTMLTTTSLAGYVHSCCAVRDADNSNIAGQVIAPVLCISGECDLAAPPATGRKLCESFSNGRYVEFSACGHLPHAEEPQKLAKVIQSLMEELH